MAKILILGGGFGGLTTAEKLSASLGSEHQITLVSQFPEFIFYPALMHVAFGNLEPDDIKFDLRAKLHDLGVRFVQGEVLSIDSKHHSVKLYGDDFSGDIYYDYLVIALGRRLATEKVGGFFEYSHHLLGIKAALKFRKAIETFERGAIIVGMCPDARLPVPVCETAFGLAQKFADKIADKKVSIRVVFPETVETAFGGAKIHREIEAEFSKYKIEIVTNFPVDDISKTNISAGEKSLNYDLLMMLPPFRGQALISQLGTSADDSSYAKVNRFLQVEGLEQTYAVGDITAFSGPKFASLAVQQSDVVTKNILSELAGGKLQSVYSQEIATIIDEGGGDSIYLHYGIWDDSLYRLKTGSLWDWAKYIHERFWQTAHPD